MATEQLRQLAGRLARRLDVHRARRPDPVPPDTAWFDAADARSEITLRAVTADDRDLLESWVDKGYAIVDQLVPHDLIDEMVADLDRLFMGDELVEGVGFNDLVLADGHRATITHSDLMGFEREDRIAARDRSNWRVHGFYQHSGAADRIRNLPDLRRVASMILGVESRAHYSINFHNGSTQSLHEDSAVFHLGVPNLICGAWIACEDVRNGCGPLLYFPGSHRRAMFERFDGYPLTNLRTASPEVSAAYRAHVGRDADAYEPETFLARKGDVLFWHGMLIHGGEPIRHPDLTRRSYVVHFIPAGADVADRVTGPTNW